MKTKDLAYYFLKQGYQVKFLKHVEVGVADDMHVSDPYEGVLCIIPTGEVGDSENGWPFVMNQEVINRLPINHLDMRGKIMRFLETPVDERED